MDGMIEQVRLRAYELWQMSGMMQGRDIEHWTTAECEVRARLGDGAPAKASKKAKAAVASAPKATARKSASRKGVITDAAAAH